MPQIDAVGDGAQPHQGRCGQDAGDRSALLQGHRRHHDDGRDRDPDEQTVAKLAATAGGVMGRRRESRQAGERQNAGDAPGPPGPDQAPAPVQ